MSTAITSVVAVDLLKGIILKFPSSVYCFAYGSAIFAQKNQKMGKMVDLVFVVDNPLKWHTENLRLNPNHYSFLKYFGPKTIVKVQENWACGVYYNTLVNVDNQLLKYGVISTHKAMDDLKTWTHVYISGRLQKPVRDLVPPTNSQLVKYIKQNRLSALRAALLQLPQYSTKFELYHTITELSYIGDSRMAVSENPNKVQNIVAANISGFDEIYQPLVKELHPLIEATFDDMIVQDMSSDARLKHLMALPFHLQRDISRKSGRNPALCDIEDSLVELSSLPSLGPLVRKSLADIVWKSSIQQTVQGVLTAGLFKAIKYGTEKVKKKITGSSETTLPRVLRPNITSDEVYKLEMLKEKNREDEITAFKTITLTNPAEKQIEDKSLQNNLKEAEVSSPSESQSPTLSDLELPFALKSSLSETSITKTQGFITFTVKDQTELLKPKVSGIPPILVHKLGETLPSPLHPKDEKIKVKPPEKSTPQSSTGASTKH